MNTLESWLRSAEPEARALADDKRQYSYAELNAAVNERAVAMRSALPESSYLLLRAEKSAQFVVDLLAASVAGHVPVPVDPAAPDRTLAMIAERCGRSALWEADANSDGDGTGKGNSNGIAFVTESAVAPQPTTALVLFTSGTSGTPKGVPVSWQNLAHSVTTVAAYLDYPTHNSAAVVLPLHYSYALLTQVLAMFCVGGYARIFAKFRNPIKVARAMESEAIQSFCGVPSTFQAMVTIHRMQAIEMPAVRAVCSAGAAMDRSLMPDIQAMFPNARFFDNYGMTEATPRISFIASDDPKFAEPTCGKAIDGLEICVFDERSGAAVADGVEGIVAVRGPNVFSGYLNDPAATERAFNAQGFLLSGDYGYLEDGYLYIVGRADDVFNVGGEKIAPLEIERALAEHPAVIAAGVGRFDDPQRGLVAVAYLETAQSLQRRELLDFLAERLAPAKIPHRFVQVNGFPLTANGKLQRARLSPDDETYVIAEIS